MAWFSISKSDVREVVREELVRAGLTSKQNPPEQPIKEIKMKLSELPAAITTAIAPLRDLPTQLEKIKQEVIDAIKANNPDDPDVPQAVLDALAPLASLGASVKAGTDAVDALIEDKPAQA